ncbi:MAG: hypothetical protein EOP83_15325 [Verrucomicrobiaceae bacterium]|nr:MAG: hypothetical protein EOP83_15325 [Verrucomicrobiaceae bacterium]
MGERFRHRDYDTEAEAEEVLSAFSCLTVENYRSNRGTPWDTMITWCNSTEAPGQWEVQTEIMMDMGQTMYWLFSDPNTAFEFKMRFL